MKIIKITCDYCEKDITKADGAMPGHRLILSCENLPITCGFSFAVLNEPPIKYDHYFCHLKCLKDWSNK